jgi:hypothetical protein
MELLIKRFCCYFDIKKVEPKIIIKEEVQIKRKHTKHGLDHILSIKKLEIQLQCRN